MIKNTINAGTSVIERNAPAAIAKVFVNARGVNSIPSCPVSAKIGKNETTISASAKKIGRPTSCEDFKIISIRSLSVGILPSLCSNLCSILCAFSIITILASTIAPMAMAIPPRLIMFEPIPKSFISKKVKPTVSGRTRMTISEDRKCIKKSPMITTTMILSSMSVFFRVSTALSISPERS